MNGKLSREVVDAIARNEGTSPGELDYALQEYVDMDALRLLEKHKSDGWRLSFEIPGHIVTVSGDGTITIDGEPVKPRVC